MAWFRRTKLRPLVEHLIGLLNDDNLWSMRFDNDAQRRIVKHKNKNFTIYCEWNRYDGKYSSISFEPNKFDITLNNKEFKVLLKSILALRDRNNALEENQKYNDCYEMLTDVGLD